MYLYVRPTPFACAERHAYVDLDWPVYYPRTSLINPLHWDFVLARRTATTQRHIPSKANLADTKTGRTMSAAQAWAKIGLTTAGLTGVGWLIMKATTPDEKKLYDSLSPDLKKQVDELRTQRQTQKTNDAALLGNPDEAKPVWSKNSTPR